ncbi:LOW QUALITY PROTEIN: reverse transcriptase, partial [Phytophthora megakarya]
MVRPPGPCTKGEDEILGAIAASTTARAKMDDPLTEIAPRKEPKRWIQAPIGSVDPEEELWVISFDGSARVKRGGGAFRWEVFKPRSGYLESLTINEAEYNGLILGLDMLEDLDHKRLVVCGDSNLVIRQVRGEIDCKAPGLTILKRKALIRLRKWRDDELVHVKRDGNGSADSLASAALQRQGGIEVQKMPGYQDLVTLNRLDEILIPKTENPVARVIAVTTRAGRAGRARPPASVMEEGLIREILVNRIKQAQEEEVWIAGMKKYLSGSIADFTQAEARSYGKIAADYEVDEQDLLFYCPSTPRSGDDRDRLMRLVVPETLQSDVLHHYHTTLEGGHQGIIAMDHIPSLPRSHKGNTELLIWVDLFTGYVIAKAISSRSAQTVAESYKECAFRRAREMIRHDRDPGFMSDFFRAFIKILGQRQRATMAYRPQDNGTAERMVQTATRALKMYVRDLDQKDWDEYAEALPSRSTRLTIGSEEIPLTIWCMGGIRDRHWRLHCQSDVRDGAIETRGGGVIGSSDIISKQVNARLKEAIADRAGRHNEDVGSHQIEAEFRIWLYLDRVKEGYERKLAHATGGPISDSPKRSTNSASSSSEIAGTGYQIFPVVHVSKLKLVKDFPDRPRVELTVDEADRLDFDEILLLEDSWVPDLGADEYEVERTSDMRSGKKTRFGRICREFLVHWAGYYEPTWVDEADLNCGVILNSFLRQRANRNLFM